MSVAKRMTQKRRELYKKYQVDSDNSLIYEMTDRIAELEQRVSIDTNNIDIRAMVSEFVEKRTKSTFDWIDSEELLEAIVEQALEAAK